MSFLTIGNINNPPLNNVNGNLANLYNSHVPGIPFSSTINPAPLNPNAMPLPGNNVLSAAGTIPCLKGGSKLYRKKINKISRKYKMTGSRKNVSRRVRRIKSRIRSKYSKKTRSNKQSKLCKNKRHSKMKGGVTYAPNYPGGNLQFDNNKVISNTYATGTSVPGFVSAMANPPTFTKVGADVDNLNHFSKNIYGNNVGSGFPSRGWF
jgi:hypothetical protein